MLVKTLAAQAANVVRSAHAFFGCARSGSLAPWGLRFRQASAKSAVSRVGPCLLPASQSLHFAVLLRRDGKAR